MSLIACPDCNSKVSNSAPNCPQCGCPIKSRDLPTQADEMPVVVTDFDMSFLHIMGFMVKAALAAIPAMLILIFLGAVVVALFNH